MEHQPLHTFRLCGCLLLAISPVSGWDVSSLGVKIDLSWAMPHWPPCSWGNQADGCVKYNTSRLGLASDGPHGPDAEQPARETEAHDDAVPRVQSKTRLRRQRRGSTLEPDQLLEPHQPLESVAPLKPRQHVDVLIGSGGHGHTFPGARTPFGMVVATPWAKSERVWDSQSGFDSGGTRPDLHFYGMAHTALSGAGSGELGELRLLPRVSNADASDVDVTMDRASVKGSGPGYFRGSAKEDGSEVFIESTATRRAAVHRFSFAQTNGQGGKRYVEVHLEGTPNQFYGFVLKDGEINATSDRTVEGRSLSTNSGMGGANSYLCFVIRFNKPFSTQPIAAAGGEHLRRLEFARGDEPIEARVAVSRFDLAHARATLEAEVPEKLSFEELRKRAEQAWDQQLGTVEVEMMTPADSGKFYTALYHSMLFPELISESDGSFRVQRKGPNSDAMKGEDFRLDAVDEFLPRTATKDGAEMYATFSLWDTYRSVHPLLNLVVPQTSADFGQSLLEMLKRWGYLPPWQLDSSPTDMMEGDGGSIVLVGMALAGLLPEKEVLEAVSKARDNPVDERVVIMMQGSVQNGGRRVSRQLEQSRADSCVAKLANRTGDPQMLAKFSNRAGKVFDLWQDEPRAFGPQGEGLFSIDAASGDSDFTEGTPRQYSFAVEWDMERFVKVRGGRQRAVCDIDKLFYTASLPGGNVADLSGNVHGFTMGNEPDMHVPYMYGLLGNPSGTQKIVDHLVKDLYSTALSGLPGNDDLGAMSSWLVFSMLGFYPMDPCSGQVVLGRPFVKKARLRKLEILVHDQGPENKFVRRAQWTDLNRVTRELDMDKGPVMQLSDLAAGGVLEFWMTAEEGTAGACADVGV